MVKWASITFGIGVLLCLYEIYVSSKKKEGFTRTDRQRVVGLFGLTCAAAALVAGLIYLAGGD